MATNIRLRTARVARGLTQLKLAEAVGLKEIAISRIETGRSTPDAETKQRISIFLEKSVIELFPN